MALDELCVDVRFLEEHHVDESDEEIGRTVLTTHNISIQKLVLTTVMIKAVHHKK